MSGRQGRVSRTFVKEVKMSISRKFDLFLVFSKIDENRIDIWKSEAQVNYLTTSRGDTSISKNCSYLPKA